MPSHSDEPDPIDDLLLDCLSAGDEAERAETLALACAQHPEHAGELHARLRVLGSFGMLVDTPFAGASERPRLGPFRLLRRLGSGGMGVVYLAVQDRDDAAHDAADDEPRTVALKLIRPELLGSELARQRFARETRAAREVTHENLGRIYDAGEIDGQPFLAMEFVDGPTLDAELAAARTRNDPCWSGRDPTSSRQPSRFDHRPAVALVERIALAAHAAHEAGFVHRDIKPANVMLAADGRPVLLDFGLVQHGDGPSLTGSGALLGTPAYMAPEQVGSADGKTDRRTDVHALGALLYECLTLRVPFAGNGREDTYRRILTEEPIDPQKLQPAIDRRVATVVHKALAKQPAARYQTAAELARDLRSLLDDAPITARPPGPLARARRWSRRRPVLATAVAGVALAVLASAAVGAVMLRSLQQRNRTLQLQQQLLAASERIAADPARAAVLAADLHEEHGDEASRSTFLAALGALRRNARLDLGALPTTIAATPDGSTIAVGLAADPPCVLLLDAELRPRRRIACDGPPLSLQIDAQRQRLLVHLAVGARILDLAGDEVAHLARKARLRVAQSYEDGTLLTLTYAGILAVRDIADGSLRWRTRVGDTLEDGDLVLSADYDPVAEEVLVGTRQGRLSCWSEGQAEPRWSIQAQSSLANCVRFLPGGRISTCSRFREELLDGVAALDPHLRVWDRDGKPVDSERILSQGVVFGMTPSPSGNRFVAATSNHRAYVLQAQDDELTARPATERVELDHDNIVTGARFVDEGRVLTWTETGQAHLWRASGQHLASFGGHRHGVVDATVTADGGVVITIAADNTLRRFDLASRWTRELCSGWGFNMIRLEPDSDVLVTLGKRLDFRRWPRGVDQARDARLPAVLEGDRINTYADWCPERRRYLVPTAVGEVFAIAPELPPDDPARVQQLRPADGSFLWQIIGGNGVSAIHCQRPFRVELLAPDGAFVQLATEGLAPPFQLGAISPDGRRLVAGFGADSIAWFDTATGRRQHTTTGIGEQVTDIAFWPDSPDEVVAATNLGGLWRCRFGIPGGELLARLPDGAWVADLDIRGDGTIATADHGASVRLWKPDGTLLLRLGLPSRAHHVTFDATGTRLAAASIHGDIRVWKMTDLLATPRELCQRSPYRAALSRARAQLDAELASGR